MPLAEVLSLKIYTKNSAPFVGTVANLRYICTATYLYTVISEAENMHPFSLHYSGDATVVIHVK